MKSKKLLFSLAALSSFMLAACGETTTDEDTEVETPDTEQVTDEENEQENNPEFVEIEDSAGNIVEVPFNPDRVAVFDNGVLSNLDALGAGDSVALTVEGEKPTHLSNYNDVEGAGSFFEIDLEATFAAEPDLIIVAGRSSAAYEDLEEIAPTIDLSFDWNDYWGSAQENLRRLGEVFGKEEEAESVISDLDSQIEEVATQAEESDLQTLVTIFNEGSLSAFGPSSRYGVIHDDFGFSNIDDGIDAAQHGMDISFEYVLEQDPDVLFVIDRTAAIGGDDSAAPLEDNPLIQETQAYQNDQIIYLTPDAWYLAEGGATTIEIMLDEVSTVLE